MGADPAYIQGLTGAMRPLLKDAFAVYTLAESAAARRRRSSLRRRLAVPTMAPP